MAVEVKRGDIFLADLSPVVGSEQGGTRPVLIVQNDVGNRYSPTVIVAAITSRIQKSEMPTHVALHEGEDGIKLDSFILLEQLRTIDRARLLYKLTTLGEKNMHAVDVALTISLGMARFD